MDSEELDAVRDALLQLLNYISPEENVAWLSYDEEVLIHVYRDNEHISLQITADQANNPSFVREILGVINSDDCIQIINEIERLKPNWEHQQIFLQVQSSESIITSILSSLEISKKPRQRQMRARRATGLALQTAIQIIEVMQMDAGTHIILLSGGPCTYGPGLVTPEKLEDIRNVLDTNLENQLSKRSQQAKEFYSALGERALKYECSVSLFAFTPEQFGLYEMTDLFDWTGGFTIVGETFTAETFRTSLRNIFNELMRESNTYVRRAQIEIIHSPEIEKIEILRNCYKPRNDSDHESNGKTVMISDRYFLGQIYKSRATGFIITLSSMISPGKQSIKIQFKTSSYSLSSKPNVRITTVMIPFLNINRRLQETQNAFNWISAAHCISSLVVRKSQNQTAETIRPWVERTLVKLARHLTDMLWSSVERVQFTQKLISFAQFTYHLLRHSSLTGFGAVLDEKVYLTTHVLSLDDENALKIFLPALKCYRQDEVLNNMKLNFESMQSGSVLLLDTFFQIIIWQGQTEVKYRIISQKDNQLLDLFDAAKRESQVDDILILQRRMTERIPAPAIIYTYPRHSYERLLISRLSHEGSDQQEIDSIQWQQTMSSSLKEQTDVISFEQFIQELKEVAVQQDDETI